MPHVARLLAMTATLSLCGYVPAVASVATDIAVIDAKLAACTKGDDSTMNLKSCVGDAYDAADKLLNRVYEREVVRLKGAAASGDAADAAAAKETLTRLIASERAWVAYKTADCVLQGVEMLGGTGEQLAIGDCLLAQTKQRAKRLEDLFATPK